MKKVSSLPIAVIGAGPIGLSAAAHLAERNIPFILFEAGPSVGHNFTSYRHVRLFSPWRFNIDHAALRLLESEGWNAPDPLLLPTSGEVVDDYIVPLSRHAATSPPPTTSSSSCRRPACARPTFRSMTSVASSTAAAGRRRNRRWHVA